VPRSLPSLYSQVGLHSSASPTRPASSISARAFDPSRSCGCTTPRFPASVATPCRRIRRISCRHRLPIAYSAALAAGAFFVSTTRHRSCHIQTTRRHYKQPRPPSIVVDRHQPLGPAKHTSFATLDSRTHSRRHSKLYLRPAILRARYLERSKPRPHPDNPPLKMMETRSQTRQLFNQRPAYPQISSSSSASSSSDNTPTSTPSSAFNSSSSLSYTTSPNGSSATPAAANMPQQMFTSAPMPSPSVVQRQNYFGSASAQGPTSHPEQQQSQQHRTSVCQQHMGQRGGGHGAPETAPFLQDFNLVAEAAKRAQTACLMRDFDEMEL
jgi:hypothetical protein